MVAAAAAENAAVSAVQATHESKLPYYGAVEAAWSAGATGFTRSPKSAETDAHGRGAAPGGPGLRAGFYLCFFGMHAAPTVMDLLSEAQGDTVGTWPLSSARRWPGWHDRNGTWRRSSPADGTTSGCRYGLLTAQLALALEGQDRDEVLTGRYSLRLRS